ncbi:MAG: hypothetical protein K8F62_10740 [Pseudorhodoplanes sp.]|nr:hypothetical protein [Pseudorhodoplanes sp.]
MIRPENALGADFLQGPQHPDRIGADGLGDRQKFDDIDAALAAFVFSDK